MTVSRRLADHRGLRVLHADDHVANRLLVQEILISVGHQPLACCGGEEALELLDRHAVDVVLMDINMPGLNGIDAVGRLRRGRSRARHVPVIALTSELRRSVADYQTLGFTDFVSKPFAISDLLQAIERCAASDCLDITAHAGRPNLHRRMGAARARTSLTLKRTPICAYS
ncbi:response regulator [Brevundimonas sp.]|uniref:response regulator n=1 Tax=Brevundimonas sp. TaxID=1871086 RepID=UPI002AB853E7|nr:response regulator [Brevundimonas sp.]MDZ4365035.1 response regulator [Brevundimonas sp.]